MRECRIPHWADKCQFHHDAHSGSKWHIEWNRVKYCWFWGKHFKNHFWSQGADIAMSLSLLVHGYMWIWFPGKIFPSFPMNGPKWCAPRGLGQRAEETSICSFLSWGCSSHGYTKVLPREVRKHAQLCSWMKDIFKYVWLWKTDVKKKGLHWYKNERWRTHETATKTYTRYTSNGNQIYKMAYADFVDVEYTCRWCREWCVFATGPFDLCCTLRRFE